MFFFDEASGVLIRLPRLCRHQTRLNPAPRPRPSPLPHAMSKQSQTSPLKEAIDRASKAASLPPASLPALDAYGQCPPLDRIDAPALVSLTSLTRLSLSTNAIDRVAGVGALPSLRVLSLGRNSLRRLDGWRRWPAAWKSCGCRTTSWTNW